MFPLLPTTLNDEPVAEKVTAVPTLTPIVTTVAAPTSLPSDFLKLDAVMIPEYVAPPYTFKVAPVPTFISDVVVNPEMTNPLETVGAPFAILFVMMLVLNLDIFLFLDIYVDRPTTQSGSGADVVTPT